MVQGRAVMRKLGPEPRRNQGGEDDTRISDWPGCHHLLIWLVVDTTIITVEWQLSPPGQDQNKVLASGLYAAKIIAIPLTSFLQFSRAPIIWRCNIWIKLMLNDHHLHLLDTFNVIKIIVHFLTRLRLSSINQIFPFINTRLMGELMFESQIQTVKYITVKLLTRSETPSDTDGKFKYCLWRELYFLWIFWYGLSESNKNRWLCQSKSFTQK